MGGTNTLPRDTLMQSASGGYDTTNAQVAALKILNAVFQNGFWSGDVSVILAPSSTTGIVDVNGNRLTCDTNGNTQVTLASLIAGEDLVNNVLKVEQRFSWAYVTGTGSTSIKASPGFLHTLTFGSVSTGTIQVYDGASLLFAFAANAPINTYTFDVQFTANLAIVTSAAAQIGVSYR